MLPRCGYAMLRDMDEVVAVAVELDNGATQYFLAWGRIQNTVNPDPLAQLVLGAATGFSLGGSPVAARVCQTLCEAADSAGAPYFYEGLLPFSRVAIPFGDGYEAWRARVAEEMKDGKHLYYCGSPT